MTTTALPENMKKKCVIYVRVSSEKQVDGYSLDSQEELCRRRAEQMGYEIIAIYREEGVSAKTTKRPVLQEMLSFCLSRKNLISSVFVYSLSRLNRNTQNHLMVRGLLSKSGVGLISLTEPTESSPVGTFIETIFAANAQMENENRAITVANSLRRRFLEGNITSKPPFGYLMQKLNGKSIAVKDHETFFVMQEMWRKVGFEGWSLNDVANYLNKKGVRNKTKSNFKRFTAKAMTQIFANKFYMGILVSEKYGQTTGKHTTMIDEILYFRVRDILTGRKPKSTHYSSLREDFKLRKILRCKDCSANMTSSWSQGRNNKVPLYYCPTRGKHRIDSYNTETVEKKFVELLQTITYDKAWLELYVEIVKERYHSRYDEINRTHKIIEHDIAELEAARKNAVKNHALGKYSDIELQDLKNEFDSEIVTKKGILAEKKLLKLDIDAILEFIVFYFSHLDRVWLDATPEGRVAIAGSILPEGVVWDGKKFRTAILGLGYKATREAKNASILLGEPDNPNFEPLLQAYYDIYRTVKQYVPAYAS